MERLLYLLLLAGIIYLVFCIYKYNKRTTHLNEVINNMIRQDSDIKKTLLIGLYHQYNCNGKDENPWDFERFTAKIMEKHYKGLSYVTAASNDFGVDIELKTNDGIYLGQVKCYDQDNKVGFEPIAIIHSQMIKQKAKRGFVVTTSQFTNSAKSYVEGLNIDLIDGMELIEIWAKSLQVDKEKASKFIPATG